MYSELVGENTDYILIQIDAENNGSKVPVFYADYNGGFSTTDLASATRFRDRQKALDLSELQNQIGEIMESRFRYEVIEEKIGRQVISEVVLPEPEDEVGE